MSKGLEALNKLCNYSILNSEDKPFSCTLRKEAKEYFEVIEKNLKEHEQYKDFVQDICNYLGLDDLFPYTDLKEIGKQIKVMSDNSHWFVVKQNEKKLTAFEIVKAKMVDVYVLSRSDSHNIYNERTRTNFARRPLTQEEFYFIKAALL